LEKRHMKSIFIMPICQIKKGYLGQLWGYEGNWDEERKNCIKNIGIVKH
jgi:hypothetical protein